MELSTKDKKLLLKWGYGQVDFKQIEDCMNNATFQLWTGTATNNITNEKALWYCGRERFLCGCSRAAFHASAVRDTRFKTRQVYFHYKFW